MSEINDALKRARRDRPSGVSPAAGPALCPATGKPDSADVGFLYLLFIFLAILAIAGSFLWLWFQSAKKAEIRARATATAIAASAPAPVQPPSEPVPAPVVAIPEVVTPATNLPASTPTVESHTFKLQGIFYRDRDPSAVVNRETVFVGSKVDGARVTAIDRDSVTIVTAAGQTKVLVLSQ